MIECRGFECIHKTKANLFTSASNVGAALPNTTSAQYLAVKNHSQYPINSLQSALSIYRQAPQLIYQLPFDYSKTTGLHFHQQFYTLDSEMTMYYHRFMTRQNYFYRRLVAQSLHQFYVKNNVTPKTRCVAAQVRRRDRILYGVNMTEFCGNWSRPKRKRSAG